MTGQTSLTPSSAFKQKYLCGKLCVALRTGVSLSPRKTCPKQTPHSSRAGPMLARMLQLSLAQKAASAAATSHTAGLQSLQLPAQLQKICVTCGSPV